MLSTSSFENQISGNALDCETYFGLLAALRICLCLVLFSSCATNSKQELVTGDYENQRTLTILKNNGVRLDIKIGRMHTAQETYLMTVKFEGQKVEQRKVSIGDEISFPIEKRGKYTLDFLRIGGLAVRHYLLWRQNIFVQPRKLIPLTDEQVRKLATKHAPILTQHPDERYFPSSLEYITNQEKKDKALDQEQFILWSGKKRFAAYKYLFFFGNPLVEQRSRLIHFPFKDLRHVLPFNGDTNAVLKTGIDGFITGTSKHKTLLAKRYGNEKNITVYYSYFINRPRNEFYLHYHFLYSYDSKLGDEKTPSIAAHIMDRESMSLILKLDSLEPTYVVYGAHIGSQRISILDEFKKELQKWDGGRTFVRWKDVGKFGDHPLGSIAKGSHALYPVVGTYRIYLRKQKEALREEAGGGPFLIPSGVSEFETKHTIHNYYLKDLRIWDSNSSSDNYLISYGGALADGILFANSSFPPYTDRELEVDSYLDWSDPSAYIANRTKIPRSARWSKYFNQSYSKIPSSGSVLRQD